MCTLHSITLGLFAAAALSSGRPSKVPDPRFDITLDDISGQRNDQHPLRPQLHSMPRQGRVGDASACSITQVRITCSTCMISGPFGGLPKSSGATR